MWFAILIAVFAGLSQNYVLAIIALAVAAIVHNRP